MQIYADYITPITTWLHHHPEYALIFTFIIALLESLAVIGTIIPGSLTMTAIGILAGSDVMRLDLTLLIAALGAFIGDSLSYLLGSVYSERLTTVWPFSKYPSILSYGQDFFDRHGGKSVLIGRFTGPLRSIIPIIAGMMHMPQLQFFSANFISAIGWAILYVIPGYIIGAASHQLSPDSAQRLFALVIGILIGIWILSLLLKYLAKLLNIWFVAHVYILWQWSKKHKSTQFLIKKLINKKEGKPQDILSLSLIWFYCMLATIILASLVLQENWLTIINQPITLFLQTLRTHWLDKSLILISFIFTPLSLASLAALVSILAIVVRDWRFLKYWLGLIGTTCLLLFFSANYLFIQPPIRLFSQPCPALFPAVYLCIATALCTFLINYLVKKKPTPMVSIMTGFLILCLLLSGVAILFMGDNWLSSVLGAYVMGASVGLLFWIAYRRKAILRHSLSLPMTLIPCLLLCTTMYNAKNNFKNTLEQHTPKLKQHVLNQDTWWYQYNEPLLPIYSTNRIGRRIGLFNVQYAGSIQELEKRLEVYGWKSQPKSFLYTLLIHAEGRYTTEELPIMEQLYLNKNPALTMSYRTVNDNNLYILRLWRSNYYLMHYQEPIWLGKIILAKKRSEKVSFNPNLKTDSSLLFTHLLPAVHDYQIARMDVTDPHLKSLPYEMPSELLIIKN